MMMALTLCAAPLTAASATAGNDIQEPVITTTDLQNNILGEWHVDMVTTADKDYYSPEFEMILKSNGAVDVNVYVEDVPHYYRNEGKYTLSGNNITVKMDWVKDNIPCSETFTGTVDGNAMKGTSSYLSGETGTWSACRSSVFGVWKVVIDAFGIAGKYASDYSITLKQDGMADVAVGSMLLENEGTYTLNGNDITVKMTWTENGTDYSETVTGTIDGNTINGKTSFLSGETGIWKASKINLPGIWEITEKTTDTEGKYSTKYFLTLKPNGYADFSTASLYDLDEGTYSLEGNIFTADLAWTQNGINYSEKITGKVEGDKITGTSSYGSGDTGTVTAVKTDRLCILDVTERSYGEETLYTLTLKTDGTLDCQEDGKYYGNVGTYTISGNNIAVKMAWSENGKDYTEMLTGIIDGKTIKGTLSYNNGEKGSWSADSKI